MCLLIFKGECNLKITPLDIYKREFKRAIRGVDPDDVEEFLGQVANDYEELLNENAELKKQIESLKAQSIGSNNINEEEIMNKIILEAKGRAEKEAEYIIQKAKAEAEKIIADAKSKSIQANTSATNANEIIQKANQDAAEIIELANQKAENIIQNARNEAEKIRAKGTEPVMPDDMMKKIMEEANNIIQKAKKDAEAIIQSAKERSASDETAQSRFNMMLEEAKAKADAILEKAKSEEIAIRLEILRLKSQKERYLMGYKDLLDKHLKMLTDEDTE